MSEVIIIDDEALIRSTLVTIFEISGWQACSAGSPEEALGLISMACPRPLLVADLNLGESVDGFEVADRARGIRPDLSVLYVSGEPERLTGLDLSCRERALTKPFRTEELLAAVRDLLPPPALPGA
ncbi:response regulator [Roseomonas sp. OT10]|uniref:response regulator n=1 Tax=Roseomonas cutis TaxID=2897332 RepID=UPI001E535041|nr:response regulator [Roseomonas sp. OT10]UFN50417.1 response regulator [Roseomonas sp. OT10]